MRFLEALQEERKIILADVQTILDILDSSLHVEVMHHATVNAQGTHPEASD